MGILCGLAAMMLCGCITTTRYLWAQADHNYTAVKINDWVRNQTPAGTTIRVLLVHGMNDFPFGGSELANKPNLLFPGVTSYAQLSGTLSRLAIGSTNWQTMFTAAQQDNWGDFIDFIAQKGNQLGFKEDTAAELADHNEFRWVRDPGVGLAGFIFTRTFRNTNGATFKFYIVNWGLGAAIVKERTFGSWAALSDTNAVQGQVNDYGQQLNQHRSIFNKKLKLDVMDWGLGDAALYLNSRGNMLREPVKQGLAQMLTEAGPQDHLAIITHSLGSTITMDALLDYYRSTSNEGNKLKTITLSTEQHNQVQRGVNVTQKRASNIAFYMFANQYGLLKIGGDDSLAKLGSLSLIKALDAKGAAVQVYAFTDPNDLLSYPINPQLPGISACNIYVVNREFIIPGGREPLAAHENYQINLSVLKAMLEGPTNVKIVQ
jgi:hypothetical protein